MRKHFAVVIGCCILALLGWKVYQKVFTEKEDRQKRGRHAVAVEVEPVRVMTIRDIRLFSGTLFARSEFIVAPKIGGCLENLTVQIGDSIKRGQLIARLDDDEYEQKARQAGAELEVAKAQVEQCRTRLSLAKREFDRVQTLRKKKISSEAEFDSAESEYKTKLAEEKVVLAQKAQREAAMKAAQVRLGYTRISAAWEDGSGTRYVGERFVDEGAMLTPNTPIVSIIDIQTLTAVIHVIERDYPKMRVGQKAVVTTDALPEKSFTGKIVRIAPMLKATSRQARVEIEMPNPELLLKPGMFARVRIQFSEHANATVVPRTALVKRNNRQGVFLVDAEKKVASFIPVKVGIVSDKVFEVLEPALSGSVVTLGHHLLAEKASVLLPGDGSPGSGKKTRKKLEKQGARP